MQLDVLRLKRSFAPVNCTTVCQPIYLKSAGMKSSIFGLLHFD